MVTEGLLARLCIASVEVVNNQSPGILNIPYLQVAKMPPEAEGGEAIFTYPNAVVSAQIVKLFEGLNLTVTVAINHPPAPVAIANCNYNSVISRAGASRTESRRPKNQLTWNVL